ncbi:50S ribosomal protein L10 [Candidatus Shapirobacteria bacterium]|nr:50S ribosomal protein L10 [Candidatus Shapirobacteria bacterium]
MLSTLKVIGSSTFKVDKQDPARSGDLEYLLFVIWSLAVMVKQSKIYEVENLKALIEGGKSAALIDYQGLTAEQVRELRFQIKKQGGLMFVAKNTLLMLALKTLGIDLPETLTGPTALVVAYEDEIAPLKKVAETKKRFEKPEFKLGLFQGKLLSLTELERLVALPNKETLLAQFIGGLSNPLFRLAYALNYHQQKFILTLKVITESKGGEN